MRELTLLAGCARRRVNTASISCFVGPAALVDDMVVLLSLLGWPLYVCDFFMWILIVFVASLFF